MTPLERARRWLLFDPRSPIVQGVANDESIASLAAAFAEVEREALERAADGILSSPQLMEVLADIEHQRWANWMRYMQVAPPEKRADWPRKVNLVYWGLTNEEQESDRIEVRKTLAPIANFIRALAGAPQEMPPVNSAQQEPRGEQASAGGGSLPQQSPAPAAGGTSVSAAERPHEKTDIHRSTWIDASELERWAKKLPGLKVVAAVDALGEATDG